MDINTFAGHLATAVAVAFVITAITIGVLRLLEARADRLVQRVTDGANLEGDRVGGSSNEDRLLDDRALGKTDAGARHQHDGLVDHRPTHAWITHAYPLQQIRIELQGTRHSDRVAVIDQLDTVLARLRAGELAGDVDDDDFGYRFVVDGAISGPSIFDRPPCATRPV